MYTLQGTNVSPKKSILKMIFLFPQVGYVNFLEGILLISTGEFSPEFEGEASTDRMLVPCQVVSLVNRSLPPMCAAWDLDSPKVVLPFKRSELLG